MQQEITFAAIAGFEGLDETLIPGTNPKRTRSLDNVKVLNGRVLGVLGTAKYRGITGASTDLPPQSDMHKGVLVFTNDGQDRPRKYTNSGTTAVLGGTPPFCKSLVSYLDFLILLNIATVDGTFSPRTANYSNDYDVNWSLCEGNELNFNETAGELNCAKTVGDLVVVGKSDNINQLRHIGSTTRFFQKPLKFDQGVLAPRS